MTQVHDCAKTIMRNGGAALPIVCTASSRAEAVQELLLFEQHEILGIGRAQTRAIEEGEDGGSSAHLLQANPRVATLQQESDAGVEAESEEESDDDAEEEQDAIFLQPNVYGWERVRQSGAMANDVYRKSCWVFGGIVAVGDDVADVESEEDERPSRTEIYQARRQARQHRKNKRMKKRAKARH